MAHRAGRSALSKKVYVFNHQVGCQDSICAGAEAEQCGIISHTQNGSASRGTPVSLEPSNKLSFVLNHGPGPQSARIALSWRLNLFYSIPAPTCGSSGRLDCPMGLC